MKFHICNKKKLLRIHQIGVKNKQRTAGDSEPEVLFDILLCPKCGKVMADPKTIEIKQDYNIFAEYKK